MPDGELNEIAFRRFYFVSADIGDAGRRVREGVMGFRFRKTIKIFPGVHLNVSKTGVSFSVGGAPFTFNFGRGQSKVTGSLPGTGMSYQQRLDPKGAPPKDGPWYIRIFRSIFG